MKSIFSSIGFLEWKHLVFGWEVETKHQGCNKETKCGFLWQQRWQHCFPPPPPMERRTVQPHPWDPGEPGCWLGPPEPPLLPLLEWMGLRLQSVLFALWPAGRFLVVEARPQWAGVSLSVTVGLACARGSEWPSEAVLCRGLPHVLSRFSAPDR